MATGPKDMDPKKRAAAEEATRESAKHLSADDVGEAAESGQKKFEKLSGDRPSALEQAWEDLKTLIAMTRDYASGEYREIPWHSITLVAASVIYFVSPIDAIPDVIPVVGYLDDAAVITGCVKAVRKDIEAYRSWKSRTA